MKNITEDQFYSAIEFESKEDSEEVENFDHNDLEYINFRRKLSWIGKGACSIVVKPTLKNIVDCMLCFLKRENYQRS